MDVSKIIGRQIGLFDRDLDDLSLQISETIKSASILVVGAAGSIGQAVTLELYKREPAILHAVDLSENNMVELVRSIRSSIGHNQCNFQTFAIDCGSIEFEALCSSGIKYDYIYNLSALKHVRSEKDPFTLMRMIKINIFNTVKLAKIAHSHKAKNYFCVSTDKAANPVNMMGASKRIMEHFLFKESFHQSISMARFANVAFSDGSLLHGFNQRFQKQQPLSAPSDIRRYFVTPQESGELCMLAGLFGQNREIYFPKLSEEHHLETFSNIALRYLAERGFEPFECKTENEARTRSLELISKGKWPVYFFSSDTTGEKYYEEFYTGSETIDLNRYHGLGVITNEILHDENRLDLFKLRVDELEKSGCWSKEALVEIFCDFLPEFTHKETGRNLDNRM